MKENITYPLFLVLGLLLCIPFTFRAQIPSISIQTSEEIVDEPKVPATFIYTGIDGEIITSTIGIEIRGGFSQTYPKKTYDIEFWEGVTASETIDVQFGNLREDDDWVLDAMYNEPLRINSYIAHKLWLEMNELYYKDLEPKAKPGADVMYVEVTIDGEYQGIYLLSEQIDRSQLKLKKPLTNQVRGELYKGYAWDDAVLFNGPDETPDNNSLTWSGYEYRFPSEIVDWSNIEDLINFVANSTDEEFQEGIGHRFDMVNLMDYFILLNVARILDNRGKNIYLCRYDTDEPYFFAPWDLDGSWGLLWNGSNDSNFKDILSNNLYDRLIEHNVDDFRKQLEDRWNDLRSTLLNESALEARINEANQFLKDNDIYEKESEVWDYQYSDSKLDYIFNWLEKRLEYLDDYFENITDIDEEDYEMEVKVYPNPAQEYISISGYISPSTIKISSILGEEEIIEDDYTNERRIDISTLPAGIHILESGNLKSLFYKL